MTDEDALDPVPSEFSDSERRARLYLNGCFQSLEIAEEALARFRVGRSQKDLRIAIVFGRECTNGTNKIRSQLDSSLKWRQSNWGTVFDGNDPLLKFVNDIRVNVSKFGVTNVGRGVEGPTLWEVKLPDPHPAWSQAEVDAFAKQAGPATRSVRTEVEPFGDLTDPYGHGRIGFKHVLRAFDETGSVLETKTKPMTMEFGFNNPPLEHRGKSIAPDVAFDPGRLLKVWLETIREYLVSINDKFFHGAPPVT